MKSIQSLNEIKIEQSSEFFTLCELCTKSELKDANGVAELNILISNVEQVATWHLLHLQAESKIFQSYIRIEGYSEFCGLYKG